MIGGMVTAAMHGLLMAGIDIVELACMLEAMENDPDWGAAL